MNETNETNKSTEINTKSDDLKVILDKLNDMDNRIKKIELHLENINKSTNAMDNHINFIESIYDVVRIPMVDFLKYYYGYNDKQKILTDQKSTLILSNTDN